MDSIPVIGFAGFSGSGKTTLIEKLIPELASRGITTAVIKHDAHGLKFDTEGKDSSRFYNAGASYSIVNGPDTTAIFVHRPLNIEESIAMIDDVDLIIIEGYKHGDFPQIGISRHACGKGFTADLSRFAAVACDEAVPDSPVPVFDINDIKSIAGFIIENMNSFII